jgi:hypothetical protein
MIVYADISKVDRTARMPATYIKRASDKAGAGDRDMNFEVFRV